MDRKLIRDIYNTQQNIDYYIEVMKFTPCICIRNYYSVLIRKEIEKTKALINMIYKEKTENKRAVNEKQFTLAELEKYDGANGRPAYIAVNGSVYDVSLSPTWGGGTHFGLYAGKDLTNQFKGCHMGNSKILEGLLKVGELQV